MVHRNIAFPYTHDLARLISLLKANGIPWPEDLDRANALTDYAGAGRYPDTEDLLTDSEYQEALTLAGSVLDWAIRAIGAS